MVRSRVSYHRTAEDPSGATARRTAEPERLDVPTARCTNDSMNQRLDVPTAQCANSSTHCRGWRRRLQRIWRRIAEGGGQYQRNNGSAEYGGHSPARGGRAPGGARARQKAGDDYGSQRSTVHVMNKMDRSAGRLQLAALLLVGSGTRSSYIARASPSRYACIITSGMLSIMGRA